MAYQARGRDPLFDSNMQAAIERRGRELIGILVAGLGLAAALMLFSYSPDDPNWLVASDAPVQNMMGRVGASLAHPLMMIFGRGAFVLPLSLIVWGIRLAGHWRGEWALWGLVFTPFAVAMASIYASTLAPPTTWPHQFGLGGLFGDTIDAVLLTALPIGAGVGVKMLSLVTGVGLLALGGWVLGLTLSELKLAWRLFLWGLVMLYALILRIAGQGAALGVRGLGAAGSRAREAMVERREAARARAAEWQEEEEAERLVSDARVRMPPARARDQSRAQARVVRAEEYDEPEVEPEDEDLYEDAYAPLMPPPRRGALTATPAGRQMPSRAEPPLTASQGPARPSLGGATRLGAAPAPAAAAPAAAAAATSGGFLSRLPGFGRRAQAEPEPVYEEEIPEDLDPEDRIRARIAGAIRARRAAATPAPAPARPERPKGPRPLILNQTPGTGGPRTEPPLMAGGRAAQAAQPLVLAADDEMVLEEDWAEEWAPEDEMPATPQVLPQGLPQPEPRAKKVVQQAPRKPAAPSTRARAEAQPGLPLEDRYADYDYPPLNLLRDPGTVRRHHLSSEALEENARMLESVLDDYGVKGEITAVKPGPVVTMYELEPAPGLKASRVIGLADDIARSMSALSARVSTVPGRSVIGIELPNNNREMVLLREILAHRDFGDGNQKLPLALGKDIGGDPIIANLAKMPHLLIAGTTGSGKSVAINTMILSLLYKLTPEECRLIMIDPKMLELSVYDGIPHLLSPVVTDPKKAVVALKWVVGEMEERYRKMSKMGVRNIDGYNGRVREALARGENFERTIQTGFDEETGDPIFETEETVPETMPYIVVIVDEMADLMMVAGKEIEACIQRLAQMARASGIHLIMATQRPSVDVITGTIKANFPTRISFQVTSKIDSRTILGEQGAEQLLGQGDMLYMAGGGRVSRVHGPFCSDEEVEEIVTYLKGFGPPEYVGGVVEGPDESDSSTSIDEVLGLGGNTDGEDALYDQAVQIVAKDRKCSTSYIQRKLAIGYNKAARLVEQMEDAGVVSAANHVGKREVLVPEVH
ncbi:DNA translocase FtsK [Pseudoroseicyclus sp. CXY001]|uniref:DNA translocase FtsK n=1 Tax=Pseudoroseicyclus sp. CXY001 TaxID=3242492 RepID=UPI0035714867